MSKTRFDRDRPSASAAIGRNARHIDQLARVLGQWIVLGTYPGDPDTVPESPPFENGYANADPGLGFPPCRLKIDKWGMVDFEGAPVGTMGLRITTLPVGYRPPFSIRFACGGDTAATVMQVDPDGGLYQIA